MSIRRDNLPPQLTPFIGREDELDVLAVLLADPACRLMTVVGPGGIGKTRVAIEFAGRLLAGTRPNGPSFADGAWFVALQAVDSAEYIVSAIADALACPLPGAVDPRDQLLSYLCNKQTLLVLDNFEHLRDAADLLTAILTAAPGMKLLVTSREALNLQEEWRYPLGGLALPASDQAQAAEQSSAVRLFIERARHVRPDFDGNAERDAVMQICRLVEGMPLAIELAATWTRTLPCAAIASEVAGSLAFLASSMRNLPERHRSMRAVFDHSWALLAEDERGVFMRLSIFRGGFTRPAAAYVAGATLPILMALADKSLLRWEPEDRYQIHELLRQYAEERLEHSPAEARLVRNRHSIHYANFLKGWAAHINGQRQREAVAEIAADLENVRAAWHYALDQARVAELRRAAYTLYLFHDLQSRYREGADLFERAIHALSHGERTIEIGPALAELLVYLGWLSIRLGRLQQAKTVLERSQAILDRLDVPPQSGPATDPLIALGVVACALGHYTEAARLGEEGRQRNQARADRGNEMYAYYVLTNAAFAQGHYDAARRYAQQAYVLAEALQDRWFMAYLFGDMGHVARALGDYASARQHYQASYSIREEFGDPEGIAVALTHLGQVALLQADYTDAGKQFQRSMAIYHEIGDRGGLATALHGLGMLAGATGAYAAAGQHLHEALRIAAAIGYAMRTLAILTSIAELLLLSGAAGQAVELLTVILGHPASDHETCDRARKLLLRCEAELAPDVFAAASQHGQTLDLDMALARLPIAFGTGAPHPTTLVSTPNQLAVPLEEPLTEREIGVLRLIADGQSNREIADQLIISLGTTKWYISQIFGKLGVHSRTQAVMRARALGILA